MKVPSGLKRLLIVLVLVLATGLCPIELIAQTDAAVVPKSLKTIGVPPLPKQIEEDFRLSVRRKAYSFIGWTRDEAIVGYSNYYEPFFIKPNSLERTDIEFPLQEPDSIVFHPKDGSSFLFSKDSDGDEFTQLYRYNLKTKAADQLTSAPQIEFVNSFLWSDDGASVFFLNQKKKDNLAEIYLLDLKTNERIRLASLNGDTHFLVAANRNFLLFSHYLANNHTTYELLDLKTRKISSLTNEIAYFKGGQFSRDGNGIWWLSDAKSGFFNLFFYDLSTKKRTRINPADLNITAFALSPDERTLAMVVNESGADSLHIYNLKNSLNKPVFNEIKKPEVPFGVIEKIEWRNNEELGFGFESMQIPSEIRSYHIKTGKTTIWARGEINQTLVDQLQPTKIVKWKSFDNREISGFMLAPKFKDPQKKLPVLIDIHGGPKEQFQPYFNSYRLYTAARLQTAVIFPNIRGSSGFGKEFENLDNREKRGDALRDLQALLDWIKTQPELDSNRIVVKGTSYGGFMALALGLHEQNRLRAVIAEVPPVSIRNYIDGSAQSLREIYAFEYGVTSDKEFEERTESLSLLYRDNLSKWKLPLLLTSGQNDVRVPVKDIETLRVKLGEAKIPVWSLTAANEGHFWESYDNVVYLELTKIAFLIKFGS